MVQELKENLWKQFGASIDMLKNAIELCPDEYWNTNKRILYYSYHTLLFLDYYLTSPAQEIKPLLPFTLTEPENIPEGAPDDMVPERLYTRDEILGYLDFCRNKCYRVISGLTEEKLHARWVSAYKNYSFFEMLLYNMRHVQHHAAQLNLLLRQGINDAPDWVSRADEDI